MTAVSLLCLGAHASYRQDLAVLLNALVELLEEHAEAGSIVARPEGFRETRHVANSSPWALLEIERRVTWGSTVAAVTPGGLERFEGAS